MGVRLNDLRRRIASDDGMSLPELLVTMVLLAILMTFIVSMFSNFTQSLTRSQSATDSTNVAALGMNEVTRVIRSGTEIEVIGTASNLNVFRIAKRESATLYAYLDTDSANPAPLMAQFTIDAQRNLVEKRWAATKVNGYWTFPDPAATPLSTRTVAKKIVTRAGSEDYFFTYLKTVGCPTTSPTCAIVPASGDELNAAERDQIVAVQVTMKVQADSTGRAAPVTITNRVGIPNLGLSRVGL